MLTRIQRQIHTDTDHQGKRKRETDKVSKVLRGSILSISPAFSVLELKAGIKNQNKKAKKPPLKKPQP